MMRPRQIRSVSFVNTSCNTCDTRDVACLRLLPRPTSPHNVHDRIKYEMSIPMQGVIELDESNGTQ